MLRFLESVWLGFFLGGLLLLGVFGTWSETAPFWYGAGLICVAGMGAVVSRQGRTGESIGWGCLVVMLVFAGYVGWRGFTSEVRWLARQDLVFAGTALVAYGLVAVRFTGRRARLAVLAVLLLLVAANAGVGLYQYFENPRWTVFRWFGLRRAAEVSAGGFFESGNHLAGFMTLAGLPLLGVAALGRELGGFVRAMGGLGFLLAGTGVAFSTSRGGTVGFFGGMALLIGVSALFWWSERKQRRGGPRGRTGWWLLGLGFAFAGLLGVASLNLRKFFDGSLSITSLNGRGPMWDAALEQWQTSPLLGTGARSYEYMERGFRTLETKWATYSGEVDAIFAHNDYLQCLGDYGLVGLGLVLLVAGWHTCHAMVAVLKASGRNEAPHGNGLAAGLAVGSVAALAGLMVQALVEFNLHIGVNAVMTGVLLGFMATPGFKSQALPASSRRPGEPEPRPRAGAGICGRRLAMGGILAAISLVLLETGWRLAPGDFAWRQGNRQLSTAVTLPELITTSATFQRATSLDPDNGQAWYLRGLVTLEIASRTADKYAAPFYEASLTQLERCLEVYPKHPYAASQAGKLAGYLGRPDDAEAHFKTALRWGLNIQSVNELYGDHLMQRKEYYKALGYLVMGLHLSSDTDVRANLEKKLLRCLERLKQQGITPPPEAFLTPGTNPPAR